MNEPTSNVDPENKGRAIYDEADIGSGERSPGQQETEELIREIPGLPPANGEAEPAPTPEQPDQDNPHDTPGDKREESGN